MRVRLPLLLFIGIGLLLGCTQSDDGSQSEVSSTLPAQTTTTTTPITTTTEQPLNTYVVWTSGGLVEGLAEALESSFDEVSIVTGDAAPLDVGEGRVVPLDAMGIDAVAHSSFDPDGTTAALSPGSVVLGESSAAFRGLGVGDTMSFGDVVFDVVGVVPDNVVGAAEVVFDRSDPDSPVTVERFALVKTELERAEFEAIVSEVHSEDPPLIIRSEGEFQWMRHADSVLPQIFIKEALGEFSYPAGSTGSLSIDQNFIDEYLVTEEVPLLGQVRCHRVVLEMLIGAMTQVEAEGLGDSIKPEEFAGCWNARFIRTLTGEPGGVSRHSWGAAVDINAPSNWLGEDSTQHPRLVEIMAEWGFLWGGTWSIPDPMHFEYGIWP